MSGVITDFEPTVVGRKEISRPTTSVFHAAATGVATHSEQLSQTSELQQAESMDQKTGQRLGNLFPAHARPSLELLRDAFVYSVQSRCNMWEYALELQQLTVPGVSHSDLRWLARTGMVEYAQEITARGDRQRRFQQSGNLAFNGRTCFVLTRKGLDALKQSVQNGRANSMINGWRDDSVVGPNHVAFRLKPVWDTERRELRFAGRLIKHFKWKAANQERVLLAFNEEAWPDCIDDPLPPSHNVNPKRRLHDTIKCLNRNHAHRLIRFHGNGNGEGVIWRTTKICLPNPLP